MTGTRKYIDIVLPWVDGDDPRLKAERFSYMTDKSEAAFEDIAGETRYKSLGEIRYCIDSINIYAPFIRKIFIVTDRQDPQLQQHLQQKFAQGHIPIEIVDHRTIFKGYEQYLPVFNSRAIETMIWRIPGLSEHFILMNDDFLFTGPTTEADFFRNGKVVCYADWFNTAWARLLRWIKPKKNGHKNIGFKDSMLNALDILGGGPRFLCLGHTPRALKKSFYEDFFTKREDVMIRNIRHRFRDAEQFNSQELFYMNEHLHGRCVAEPLGEKVLYLKPRNKRSYIDDKLRHFRGNTSAIFCCINALCLASEADQKKVLHWMEEVTDQNLRESR
jgi:hypothetical protein